MNHEFFKRMASRLADNELDEKGRTQLDAHLLECAECRSFAADMQVLRKDVAGLEKETVSGKINRAILERSFQEDLQPATLRQRLMDGFLALKPAFAYAAVALLIGIVAGNAGFRLSHSTDRQAETPFIPEETARLFDAVYPGSLAEALREVKKEKL